VYGQTIALTITGEQGNALSFQYLNAGPGFQYTVSGLPSGVYRYKASTTLSGQAVSDQGQFVLKDQALEALHTTADFGLLRSIAKQSKGGFWPHAQFSQAQESLLSNRPPDIIHTEESLTDVLRLPWLFALLILLASFEWGLRKFKGGY
jgi:hypothetical protein